MYPEQQLVSGPQGREKLGLDGEEEEKEEGGGAQGPIQEHGLPSRVTSCHWRGQVLGFERAARLLFGEQIAGEARKSRDR